MKYREIIRMVEEDGWRQARQKGSHRHYKHPTKPGIVTIAAHSENEEVPKKTLASIMKQAGLERQR